MPWVRPAEVPVGQVWSRFKGRDRNGQPANKYQIRDMEEKHRKECLDLMQEIFLSDEPLCRVFGVPSDPVSVATIRSNWERYVTQRVSLACFTDVDGEPGELVGFNILLVRSKGEEEEDFDDVKGEAWKKVLKVLSLTEELVDAFDHYGVDYCLSDSGLTVHPAHRGQNIGGRLLEAREPFCKALGIEAVSTIFTAKSSQILAEKCGYELLGVLPYDGLTKYGIHIKGSDTPYSELRGFRFEVSDGKGKVDDAEVLEKS